MKTIPLLGLLFALCCTQASASLKKDSLGLPGDNFDLYAALELFKTSENPEAFEKAINAADNEVNNLDLDADGKVDYVKVTDKSKGDVHTLVLQVAVSKTETQDVAVIEIEKTASGEAHVQIVGDEELYGKNYIVEPKEAVATTPAAAPSKTNKVTDDENEDDVYNTSSNASANDNYTNNDNYSSPPVIVNVWAWPSVQYVYGPAYVGWSSPWYWGYYPGWWQPWPPVYWGVYYRRVYRYHYPYYHRTYHYRCATAHNYYYGQRMASQTVRQNNRSGIYGQRQATYRNNPVQGHRYNSLPANPDRRVGARQGAVRSAGTPRGTAVPVQGNRAPGVHTGGSPQPGQTAQPRRTVQPRQANTGASPGQAAPRTNIQPRQVSPQPRQMNAQPRQETVRPQSVPVQRGGNMGAPRSAPGTGHGGRR